MMGKRLRIYLPFAANELKCKMAYRGAFYLFLVINLFKSFISYYLWMAVYGSSDRAVIGGLSQSEMIVYVFMVYVTSSVMVPISDAISEDVVKGTVAMNLIKPIDYRLSLISRAVGSMIYNFLAPSVFIWIGVEIYKVTVLGLAPVTVERIILYLISCIMSFLIYVLFDFCFGMVAFFTTYILGLMMVQEALLGFLTGKLIPISFFPQAVQTLFEFLPFSSMIYTPVMIYLGKYSGEMLAFVLARQAVWIVILYVLGSMIWKRVTRRLVVLGG